MLCTTLPHAHCFAGTDRFEKVCDITSEETAYRLASVFEKLKIPNVIFTSEQNRSVLDDNRKESELTSPMHKKVEEQLDSFFCILDIHSFYENAFQMFPKIIKLDGTATFNECSLVIFTNGLNTCNDELYYFIKRHCPSSKISLVLTPDIVFILKHYMEKRKVPTFMFEFSEFVEIPQELLDTIGLFFKTRVFDVYESFKTKS